MFRRSWRYLFPLIFLAILFAVTIVVETAEPKPIVFGGALPLTGWGADAGNYNKQGYELWAEKVNESGGLLGRPVKLLIYDDQSDPTTTARLYEKLITQDKVDVLLPPWSDDMTMPATTVAEKYKKPMVTGGATLTKIWTRGYKYVCGTLPSSYDYVGVPLRLLKGKVKTGAILYCDLTYTTGFADAAEENFKELGIKRVAREAYAADAQNFTAALTKIKAQKPDLFVGCTGGASEAVQIVRQAKSIGLNVKAFYLTIAPIDPEFVNLLGKDAEYISGTTEWEPTLTHLPGFDDFKTRYIKKYNVEPNEDVATAYGVAQVLQTAIEKAGKIDDEKINQILHTMSTTTVFGEYKVDKRGMQIGKTIFAMQIQQGKRVIIYPEKYAQGNLIFPMPAWDKR